MASSGHSRQVENALIAAALKGGPGSGHHGHTSHTRIGQVGGSDPGPGGAGAAVSPRHTGLPAPVVEQLQAWEDPGQTPGKIEIGAMITSEGKVKSLTGTERSLAIPGIGHEGSTFTHYHPPLKIVEKGRDRYGPRLGEEFDPDGISGPLSPTDIVAAAKLDLAEMRAFGLYRGKWRLWRARRPEGGWPERTKGYIGTRWPPAQQAAVARYKPGTVAMEQFSHDAVNDFLRQAADELGFIYEVHEYG